MELDYENDIVIDETALEVEWLEQPSLAMRYGKYASYLRKVAKIKAERTKTLRSDLIKEANLDPEGCCGKAKPNAGDIEAYYRSQKKYKQAVRAQIDAEYEADYAELAKNEMCFTRKAALEHLVILHGQQYFAGPRVPRNITQEWEKRKKQKRANIKIGNGLRKEEDDKD